MLVYLNIGTLILYLKVHVLFQVCQKLRTAKNTKSEVVNITVCQGSLDRNSSRNVSEISAQKSLIPTKSAENWK